MMTIQADNLSKAWLAAMEYLLVCGGKETNLIISYNHIGEEEFAFRKLLDRFISEYHALKGGVAYPVTTVANTLFPLALYQPQRGSQARPLLYSRYKQSFEVARRLKANDRGTYFQRLIAWSDTKKGSVNQLDAVITRLQHELRRPNPLSSAYEIGVSGVNDLLSADIAQDCRVYQPGRDNQTRGFPCLSHISLTLTKQTLHLTALYRNQHFLHKAYGNYVGLSRLLSFLCQEAGCEPGEIVCIASHADGELSLGKKAIATLIQQCQAALAKSNVVAR